MNATSTTALRFDRLVGRTLLAVTFITAGYGKIMGYIATLDYMASHGLSFSGLLLSITILIEHGGCSSAGGRASRRLYSSFSSFQQRLFFTLSGAAMPRRHRTK